MASPQWPGRGGRAETAGETRTEEETPKKEIPTRLDWWDKADGAARRGREDGQVPLLSAQYRQGNRAKKEKLSKLPLLCLVPLCLSLGLCIESLFGSKRRRRSWLNWTVN
jgi:hypothetical protein